MSLSNRDLKVIWHPYTQMKTAQPPIGIVRGEGTCVFDEDGKKYIDAVSSWWVNIHGHSHPYIAQKVAEQLFKLEHVIFAGFTHKGAVELAERMLKILPDNQQKVFFSDDGSTAVEVAIKMCLQYWDNQGQTRTKILAFKNAYHGDTFGAMAVSGRSAFTRAFESLLFEVEFIDLPDKENIENLKSQISNLKSELACFIFEPLVQGSAGMIMYEAEYLNELMAHCKAEGVLTIDDEVFTGFGRTGKPFACYHVTEQPDIMCFSKGLTGGTMALGLTTCTNQIYDAFLSDDRMKTLFHGHSFTANPVACAAALASMDLFLADSTSENIKRIEDAHKAFAHKIKNHPKIKTTRQTGTILAMEWETGSNTSYFSSLRDKLYHYFLDAGIIMRPLGNIIYILPPYCITDAELAYIYSKIEQAPYRDLTMELNNILPHIIADNKLHARWLNTLSLMENTGARKISASEDPLTVTYIILKHAAEEHRHAFYLKKQIEKTADGECPTYAADYLLAPAFSKYYLNQLDVEVCRYLKNELKLSGKELRFAAYLLVTYAIEVRADELYPVYQDALENAASKVNVKSIILEEEGHLEEMINQLKSFSPFWELHAQKAVDFETRLFTDWVGALGRELAL